MPGGEGRRRHLSLATRRRDGPRPRRDLGSRRRHRPARGWGGLSPPPPNLRCASGPRPFPRSGLQRPLPGGSERRGPLPQAESPAPSPGRAEWRGRVARPSRHRHLTGAAGDPATRARPPRTHRASLVAGSALLSLPPRRRTPAALRAAARGVGTGQGQGAGAARAGGGRAAAPRADAGTNGPRGAGPGGPRRGARLQAAVRGGERRLRAQSGREVPTAGAA